MVNLQHMQHIKFLAKFLNFKFIFWQHIKLYAVHNGSFKANITLIQVPLQIFLKCLNGWLLS